MPSLSSWLVTLYQNSSAAPSTSSNFETMTLTLSDEAPNEARVDRTANEVPAANADIKTGVSSGRNTQTPQWGVGTECTQRISANHLICIQIMNSNWLPYMSCHLPKKIPTFQHNHCIITGVYFYFLLNFFWCFLLCLPRIFCLGPCQSSPSARALSTVGCIFFLAGCQFVGFSCRSRVSPIQVTVGS